MLCECLCLDEVISKAPSVLPFLIPLFLLTCLISVSYNISTHIPCLENVTTPTLSFLCTISECSMSAFCQQEPILPSTITFLVFIAMIISIINHMYLCKHISYAYILLLLIFIFPKNGLKWMVASKFLLQLPSLSNKISTQ